MNDVEKLLVCAVASLALHFFLAEGLQLLPEQHQLLVVKQKPTVRVVVKPPPEPEPEKPPPEPEKPPPPKPVEAPKPHPSSIPVKAVEAPKDSPAPAHAVTTDTTDEPVFGTTMESTSPTATGPAVPIGNTPDVKAKAGSGARVQPLGEPVQAFEATKMPLPQGRCYGKYNDEALKAGIEGQVVLDVIVGEDGRVREVKVTQGLGHGLDEAAISAIRSCQFTPGEKDGKPVAVRIRGFKITFVLPEQ